MAKLIHTYTGKQDQKQLIFREVNFYLTMVENDIGKGSLEKALDIQVEEYFRYDGEIGHEIDRIASIVDDINFGDSDEIKQALIELSNFE